MSTCHLENSLGTNRAKWQGQTVSILFVGSISTTQDMTKKQKTNMKNDTYKCVREEENIMSMLQ